MKIKLNDEETAHVLRKGLVEAGILTTEDAAHAKLEFYRSDDQYKLTVIVPKMDALKK